MAIFFTSDTHFGHGGALGLYRRPFPSVAAMNEALIERWNETIDALRDSVRAKLEVAHPGYDDFVDHGRGASAT